VSAIHSGTALVQRRPESGRNRRHVADVEHAIRAGLRRLAPAETEKARPIGLQRQLRDRRRLIAALGDDFAFDAAGWFHDQFDVFLARTIRQRSKPVKSCDDGRNAFPGD